MPLFYAKQTDYVAQLNLIGAKYMKNSITCSSTATKTVDLTAGHTIILNITGASAVVTTLAFSNPPASSYPFEIIIYAVISNTAAHQIIWPSSVHWPGATTGGTTNLTSPGAGKTDIFKLRSYDGGTTYYGEVASTLMNYTT